MPLDATETRDSPHKVRMTDLARLAGVSVATVSRSLSDSPLINRATKNRVLQLASETGYAVGHPQTAIVLETKRTVVVFVPLTDKSQETQPLIYGLLEAARELRCNLLFSHLGPNERDLERLTRDMEADAFLFLNTDGLHSSLNTLASGKRRFIVWGDGGADAAYTTTGPDHFLCGQTATAHLIAQGCTRIAYLGSTDGAQMQQRFMGYVTALNEAGLRFDPARVWHEVPPGKLNIDGVFAADESTSLTQLSRHEIPVIVCSNSPLKGFTTSSIDNRAAGRSLLSRLLRPHAANEGDLARFPHRLSV